MNTAQCCIVTGMDDKHEARPGRPRSTAADDAILNAAIDLLLDGGVDSVKVDVVARRAGVTRATVYRRYTTREDLVVGAFEASFRAYLERPALSKPTIDEFVADTAAAMADPRGRALLRRIMTVAHDDPELHARFRQTGSDERAAVIHSTLTRAAAAGQFPAGSDIDAIYTVVTSCINMHLLIEPDDTPVEDIESYLHRVLRTVGFSHQTQNSHLGERS